MWHKSIVKMKSKKVFTEEHKKNISNARKEAARKRKERKKVLGEIHGNVNFNINSKTRKSF